MCKFRVITTLVLNNGLRDVLQHVLFLSGLFCSYFLCVIFFQCHTYYNSSKLKKDNQYKCIEMSIETSIKLSTEMSIKMSIEMSTKVSVEISIEMLIELSIEM